MATDATVACPIEMLAVSARYHNPDYVERTKRAPGININNGERGNCNKRFDCDHHEKGIA